MNTNTIINISVRISKLEEEVKKCENRADTTGEEFYESKRELLQESIYTLKLDLNTLILNTQNENLKKEIEKLNQKIVEISQKLLELELH